MNEIDNIENDNFIVFDPTIHFWKKLVLNNDIPVLCSYGYSEKDRDSITDLQKKFKFLCLIMSNFNEDDPELEALPYYVLFNKGKMIKNIMHTEKKFISILENTLSNLDSLNNNNNNLVKITVERNTTNNDFKESKELLDSLNSLNQSQSLDNDTNQYSSKSKLTTNS